MSLYTDRIKRRWICLRHQQSLWRSSVSNDTKALVDPGEDLVGGVAVSFSVGVSIQPGLESRVFKEEYIALHYNGQG